ncbi:hypothetical protein ES703_66990 [subsurface metagenome]
MDEILRQQLEQILKDSETEERAVVLMREALKLDIPLDDTWLKDLFTLAARLLGHVYGGEEASRRLPWLLFSLGAAWKKEQDEFHSG